PSQLGGNRSACQAVTSRVPPVAAGGMRFGFCGIETAGSEGLLPVGQQALIIPAGGFTAVGQEVEGGGDLRDHDLILALENSSRPSMRATGRSPAEFEMLLRYVIRCCQCPSMRWRPIA